MKGIFITFEGPDGSGKTTQLKLLANYLIEKGFDIVTTRDPGGTIISNQIREILLRPDYKDLKNQTEILLYAASRAQLVHEVIMPALNQGKIVLCDRFIDASIAYQSYGLNINKKTVEEINNFASSGLRPARTYLLNINPEIGRKRVLTRSISEFSNTLDRIEQKDIEYHQRVLDGFNKLAEDNKERIVKFDGEQPIEDIFQRIINDIEMFLKIKKRE